MTRQRPSLGIPLVRPLAAALCWVFLALSVSSGFHRGDHDDLGWLPERFHRHAFEWSAESRDAPLPVADHCLACHLARTIVRFTPPALAIPEGLDSLLPAASTRPDEPTTRVAFSPAPRGPPAS